ncbi:MAG: hypothetical protein KAX15_02620, partial [Candidatus Omnitrophica bacterium]|nr:hypothetical protein [Candidatus Omnitrophota bacterium]
MRQKWFDIFDRGCEYSLYGLILFIPVSNAGIEICFGLAFLCFLGKKIIKPDFRFLKVPEHIPLLCFMIFSALSLVNSAPYLEKSLRALFCKWSEYVCLFLITRDT